MISIPHIVIEYLQIKIYVMSQKWFFKQKLVRMNGCMFWNKTYISYAEYTLTHYTENILQFKC
jgi:hypothetical protein